MYPVPFADHPDLFRYLPGVKALLPRIPDWEERIQQVSSRGLALYPIMAPLADRYRAYAQGLGYTEAQIEPDDDDDDEELDGRWIAPLCCLIDLSRAGILQCCLRRCAPFCTSKPMNVNDVRNENAHDPLPAKNRSLLIEFLAHALLTYNHGCQRLDRQASIHGKITDAMTTLKWLAEVLPLVEAPLRPKVRTQDLTIHQVEEWLRRAPQMLQVFAGLPNHVYANMAYPFRPWARSHFDYEVDSLWSEIVGRTFPDERPIEAPPLAKLRNLLYTRRWPGAVDESLLFEVLLARMFWAFQRYGPPAWKNAPIYAVMAAILRGFEVDAKTLTPENCAKRLQRFNAAVKNASNPSRPIQ